MEFLLECMCILTAKHKKFFLSHRQKISVVVNFVLYCDLSSV